jgi:uncharacterized OB-fold protein
MRNGTVYTETVVHAAPAALAAEAPYQVAIVELAEGGRLTARVRGARVSIGDRVVETAPLDGAPAFQLIESKKAPE